MQAVLLTKDFKMEVVSKDIPKPTETQVRIQLSACALNRRDYWITQKMYPKVKVCEVLEREFGVSFGNLESRDGMLDFSRSNQTHFPLLTTFFYLIDQGANDSGLRWMW